MKTILVTGVAGFIGSNLSAELLKKNRVIGVDSFISGQRQNIEKLKTYSCFRFIKHDICKPLRLKEDLSQVWNLACPASPPDYYRHPIKTLLTSSLGVKNMLDLALAKKAKFLHTSTSETYGNPLVHPQGEGYWGNVNPIGPRSCYDEGKRFAESLIVNYQEKYKLKTKIVRIFNTYGPGMRADDGRVVSTFIKQALKGEDLTIYGNGKQTRSFCYINDMITGLLLMMRKNRSGPINLGNSREFTIKGLAKLIIRLSSSKSKLVFLPRPQVYQDEPKQRKPDISLAKKELGWRPEVKLETGLKETIKYFRKLQ